MSANTSPDNITYPVSTDAISPLETVFATMATSVQTALTNRFATQQVKTYKWANVTARNAQTGMTEGDYGDQADTDQLFRYNGSAWKNITPGLVPVKPTSASGTGVTLGSGGGVSFSASTGVSLDGAFTADYENYVAVMKIATSASATLSLLMRVGGTPITSANYYGEIFYATGGATFPGAIGPAATSGVVSFPAGTIYVGEARFIAPLLGFAGGYWVNIEGSSISGLSVSVQKISNFMNTTTPDGFSITPSAGTMTGTIRLYGYNNI